VAEFGVRDKPKPFTSVVVFENPDRINPLPPIEDLPGSAADAEMLALYVWLAANRYEEYQRSTVCVCLAESLSEDYVIAARFPCHSGNAAGRPRSSHRATSRVDCLKALAIVD
jgi:hypothetical protein